MSEEKRHRGKLHLSFGLFLLLSVASLNAVAFGYDKAFTRLLYGDGINYDTADGIVAKQEGEALAKTIAEEGVVLLKNQGNALPLENTRVNVFGWGSSDKGFIHQGGGSARTSDYHQTDFYDSLMEAGLDPNPRLMDYYNSLPYSRDASSTQPSTQFALYEAPSSHWTEEELSSCKEYSDTAIFVLSRSAIEQADLTKVQYLSGGTSDSSRHYLEMSKDESGLLDIVKKSFSKVIVILNMANPFEVSFKSDSAIQAILQIGYPGNSGAVGVGRILLGKASPSGRLVDTYAADLTENPAYLDSGVDGSHRYRGEARYVDYRESIYVGYRYFETMYDDGLWNDVTYRDHVLYPFGYGLSYTSFKWSIHSFVVSRDGYNPDVNNNDTLLKDDVISVKVWVENVGQTNGADVVELYAYTPYRKGGIEKASRVLAGFGKTGTLGPGQGEMVDIELPLRDLASYDCFDANNDGFMGYELEGGSYALRLQRNAHDIALDEEAKELGRSFLIPNEGFHYDKDAVTNHKIENLFTTFSNPLSGAQSVIQEQESPLSFSIDGNDAEQGIVYLSRNDFSATFPTTQPTQTMDDDMYADNFKAHSPRINPDDIMPLMDQDNGLSITSLFGVAYGDPRWDKLVQEMSKQELLDLIQNAGFGTVAIPSIGKPRCLDLDGTAGINTTILSSSPGNATSYPSASTLGQTWSWRLAYEYGSAIAKEAEAIGMQGWYAPGANLHRTPIGGRNFEYFSEDPLVSGIMSAYCVSGAKDNGVYAYVKHFVADETESGQNSQYRWLTEQALREIYAKPFEIAVKKGGANAIMASKNRVGSVRATGSDALNIRLLREEWGFKGVVISDYYVGRDTNDVDESIRSGTDLMLNGYESGGVRVVMDDTSSATAMIALQRSAKNALYCYADTMYTQNVAKGLDLSHMTGAKNDVYPTWKWFFLGGDIAFAGFLVWYGFFIYSRYFKKRPE